MQVGRLVLVAVVAVLIASVAFAYAHGAWSNVGNEVAGKGLGDVGKRGWGRGASPAGGGCVGGVGNVTLYSSTRQLTISGDGINVALTVDVVGRNATEPYGRIVYGTGTIQLGGVAYTAKSVMGKVGSKGLHITVYTGRELIILRYLDGSYYAVVKTLGTAGYQRYNGTATLTIT